MEQKNRMEAERAVLVGMIRDADESEACRRSLDELARLLHTAGGEVFATMIQAKASPDPRTCIGSGKVAELSALCSANDISLVVFDMELSPVQIRNLEEDLGGEVMVIDRTMLILDIFALHAVTGEGKLQVELAQLRYSAPRLTGQGIHLSRQGGRIGTRGPGESQLESNRRYIRRRIAALEQQLEEMQKNRSVMRASRARSGIPKIAIVGYTNAGKSTLLNYLTDAGVLSEDKLFATLDPTTRQLRLPCGETVLLTDTVGLIRKLPHQLIEAFHSTLEEAALSDVLLVVADAADCECAEQLTVTLQLLDELGAAEKEKIIVYNKADLISTDLKQERSNGADISAATDSLMISAATGIGVDALLQRIEEAIRRCRREVQLFFPFDRQAELSSLHRTGRILATEYTDGGVAVCAVLDEKERGQYREFLRSDGGGRT